MTRRVSRYTGSTSLILINCRPPAIFKYGDPFLVVKFLKFEETYLSFQ